jgi:hypothetical protein
MDRIDRIRIEISESPEFILFILSIDAKKLREYLRVSAPPWFILQRED